MLPDGELEKLCLHQLNAAAREFATAGGQQASLASLALSSLTAAGVPSGAGCGAGGGGDDASSAGQDNASSGASSPHGSGSLLGSAAAAAPAAASGRAGFMHRAFARQQAASGAPPAGGNGAEAPGGGGAAAAGRADAFAAFQQRVREFNACGPYAGSQGVGLVFWVRGRWLLCS